LVMFLISIMFGATRCSRHSSLLNNIAIDRNFFSQ
jgi:hypothetical protein